MFVSEKKQTAVVVVYFWKNKNYSYQFSLLTDSCTYSDWFTISDCSATCGIGYKREVRSFTKVKSELAVAKHCNEDLERLTSCKLDPCKFKFLGV